MAIALTHSAITVSSLQTTMNPIAKLRHAFAVKKQRRGLANLSNHAMRDMGLTHEDIASEMARSFWDC